MATFELEESDFAGYIDDDSVFAATVVGVKVVEKPYVDDETQQKVKKVEFKFSLVDPDGTFEGLNCWGETSVKFNAHPDCKLRNWSSAILGTELPVGYRLDTDVLVGNVCRTVIGLREYEKDGVPKKRNFVKDIIPSADAMAQMAYAGSGAAGAPIEEPF